MASPSDTRTVPAEKDNARLRCVIRKAERDLCRASTFAYRSGNAASLERGLDKMATGIGKVIDFLRAELDK